MNMLLAAGSPSALRLLLSCPALRLLLFLPTACTDYLYQEQMEHYSVRHRGAMPALPAVDEQYCCAIHKDLCGQLWRITPS